MLLKSAPALHFAPDTYAKMKPAAIALPRPAFYLLVIAM
jgi:hypothetical protein